MRKIGLSFFVFFLTASMCRAKKPNIVILMADDLGFGDVGAFGNTTLRTPNIDRLAREGLKLTHHLTPTPLCTPNRAAFLTGRLPVRLGMAATHDLRVIAFIASTTGLPTNETTFAQLAQRSGYRTGLIGKWHVGSHSNNSGNFGKHPLKFGFDYFYGCLLTLLKDFGDKGESVIYEDHPYQRNILVSGAVVFVTVGILKRLGLLGRRSVCFLVVMTLLVTVLALLIPHYGIKFANSVMHRNFEVVEQPIRFENLTQRLVWESVDFMERHLATEPSKPFLLFVSWFQVHTFLYNSVPGFQGRSQHGPYGDNVEEMDWSTGEILKALDRLGIANDTLVLFTSDNGGHVEETDHLQRRAGGSNVPWRGGKGHGGWDGGYRVPTIVRWPGVVPPASVSDELTSSMDFFPTFAEIFDQPVNNGVLLDGESLTPLLRRPSEAIRAERWLFQYCGDRLFAVRWRTSAGRLWKLRLLAPQWLPGEERCVFMCSCTPAATPAGQPPPLYDLLSDPEERRPLDPSVPAFAEVRAKLLAAVERHRATVSGSSREMTFRKMMWRPWLQPCCNFPLCRCQDRRWSGE